MIVVLEKPLQVLQTSEGRVEKIVTLQPGVHHVRTIGPQLNDGESDWIVLDLSYVTQGAAIDYWRDNGVIVD